MGMGIPAHGMNWTSGIDILIYTLLFSHLSRIQLFVNPWTVAYQAPLSIRFSRQEYWSGLQFPYPRDLPNPRIEPASLAWKMDSLPLSCLGSPIYILLCVNSMPSGICYIAQGAQLGALMTQRGGMESGWEGGPGGRGYMCTYS